MSGSVTSLASSGLVKRVVPEPESPALARTEVPRAAQRVSQAHLALARRVLADIHLIDLDRRLLDRAAELGPPTVRSLDAIHVAAALSLGDDLQTFVTYDVRQAEAARDWGLAVVAPGLGT